MLKKLLSKFKKEEVKAEIIPNTNEIVEVIEETQEDMVYSNRVHAYASFEKILRASSNKREDFDNVDTSGILKPTEDERVILGFLRKHSNITDKDVQDLIEFYNLDLKSIEIIIKEYEETNFKFFKEQAEKIKKNTTDNKDIEIFGFVDNDNEVSIDNYFSIQVFNKFLSDNYIRIKDNEGIDKEYIISINHIITFYKNKLLDSSSYDDFEKKLLEDFFLNKIVVGTDLYYIINENTVSVIGNNENTVIDTVTDNLGDDILGTME